MHGGHRAPFEEAAKGLDGEEALHAMANAYTTVIVDQPERLMMQMQTCVAVAAAEREGDREFGEVVRSEWMRLWDAVYLPLGADLDETTTFLAHEMLINCLVAMGLPPEGRVWLPVGAAHRPAGGVEIGPLQAGPV